MIEIQKYLKQDGAVLDLTNTEVTDDDLVQLKNDLFHAVEQLRLTGTKISDQGLAHVANLPSLEKLWLFRTSVTDAGVERIKTKHPDISIWR